MSVVLENLCHQLTPLGFNTVIGCERCDDTFHGLNIVQVPATVEAVEEVAHDIGITDIVAHTSPYFELLPGVSTRWKRWVLEAGDPTPQLFQRDPLSRLNICEAKRRGVYGSVDGVGTISSFLNADIGYLSASVIPLGSDHCRSFPSKSYAGRSFATETPLRVGTLMRLGVGEAQYKGADAFLDLMAICEVKGLPIQFVIAGKGTEEDAEMYRHRNVQVCLNLTEDDKYDFLHSLDCFVSFSKWEGFNLPLAEAQAVGTFALALDVGAHPEVTPFVLPTPYDAVRYFCRAINCPSWLEDVSARTCKFIRRRYAWRTSAGEFVRMIGGA